MKLSDLLPLENIFINIDGNSKKKVLENLSVYISSLAEGASSEKIYRSLQARERLGTTAIGDGIAIPHSRINELKKITAAFFKLNSSIDFNSDDRILVDLIFVLIVPDEQDEQHLKALSLIAGVLQNKKRCIAIREAGSKHELHRILINSDNWN
jgi:PTS system nitrogen regulatory IIA component